MSLSPGPNNQLISQSYNPPHQLSDDVSDVSTETLSVSVDAGPLRYKYLELTGTGVTWVHTTTTP